MMLILITILAALLAGDIWFHWLPVRKPVVWLRRSGKNKPEKCKYTLRNGFCHLSRHSNATLEYDEAGGVFHLIQNGKDTILRKGTCVSLTDSGECVWGSRHPRRLTMTVLFLCGLLVFRFVLVPISWHSLVSQTCDEVKIQQLDYHWVPDEHLTQEEAKREDKIYNILFLITDTSKVQELRSEGMMLVSFNTLTRTVSFVSLLRDLRILAFNPYAVTLKDFHVTEDDPNYKIYEQMTKNISAFHYMQLGDTFTLNKGSVSKNCYLESCKSAALNIEQVFNIRIDGLIVVDLESDKELADAIVGIESDIRDQKHVDAIRRRFLLIQICKGLMNAFSNEREKLFKDITTTISEKDAYYLYKLFLTGAYNIKFESLPYKWDDNMVETRYGSKISYIYIPSWYLPLEDQVSKVIYQDKGGIV